MPRNALSPVRELRELPPGPPPRRRSDLDWRFAIIVAAAVWGAIAFLVLRDRGGSTAADLPAVSVAAVSSVLAPADDGGAPIPEALTPGGLTPVPVTTVAPATTPAPSVEPPTTAAVPAVDETTTPAPTDPATTAAAPATTARPTTTAATTVATTAPATTSATTVNAGPQRFSLTVSLPIQVPAALVEAYGPTAQVLSVVGGGSQSGFSCGWDPSQLPDSAGDGGSVALAISAVAPGAAAAGEQVCSLALSMRSLDCDDTAELSCSFVTPNVTVRVP